MPTQQVAKTVVRQQAAPAQLQREELVLRRYRVVEHRASGGFATVDVCWDTRLRRRVAIKRIPLGTADGPAPWQTVQEALNESRTSAMLAHPNIVTVFDFEYDNEFAYIVMEYVDGVTLSELLARVEDGRLTVDEAAHVLDSLANALAFAHENGVLHLDIKPANVMIDRGGTVKLGDFGMATLASAAGWGGARGGTVGYMSPEQLSGEYVDERADVFSLATVLYETLTAAKPFEAKDANKSLKLIEGGVRPLAEANPEVGPACSDAVDAALSPGPVSRPPSVGDFADAALPGLGDPLAGRDSIRMLMGQVEGEDEAAAESWREAKRRGRAQQAEDGDEYDAAAGAPAWLLPLGERLIGAVVCGMLAWTLAPPLGLPLPMTMDRVAMAAVTAAAALLAPAAGTLIALIELVWAAGTSGSPSSAFPLAVGLGFLTAVWFGACGMRDRLAGAGLLLPAVTGIPTAGAALTGFECLPAVAVATGFAGPLLAQFVAALTASGFQATEARAIMAQAYTKPSTWVIAVACGLGAWLAALLYRPGHPLLIAFGQLLCAAACIAGLFLGASVENGGVLTEPKWDGVAIAVSFSLLMALASAMDERRGA